jgi:hypothetical protein
MLHKTLPAVQQPETEAAQTLHRVPPYSLKRTDNDYPYPESTRAAIAPSPI